MKKVFQIIGKILEVIVITILSFIVVKNIYIFVAREITKEPAPTFFGTTDAVVISGSMEPTIHVNDYVMSKSQKEYFVGDIVMFYDQKAIVTHRIVEVREDTYVTKGDANNVSDEPIAKNAVIGKVVLTIPKLGYFVEFIQKPYGVLVVITCLVLITYVPAQIRRKKEQGGNQNE